MNVYIIHDENGRCAITTDRIYASDIIDNRLRKDASFRVDVYHVSEDETKIV